MATPSLAMIPSAYADSKVYSVLPNNGDGDFTFNRDSSATRVGQNGLIQTVGYFGNNLVTNGTFDTDSDWVKGTGWTISGGKASSDGSQTTNSLLYQSNVLTSGSNFKCEVTISNYQSGNLRVVLGGGGSEQSYSANGTYTFYGIKGSDNNLYLSADTNFIGSIDNVSVQEVTGDQPRLNYDISNGVVQSCPSLLLEPASTNLVTYSEDFSQSAWSKLGSGTGTTAVVTSNYAISPDGTLNASRIVLDKGSGTASGDFSAIYDGISLTGDGTFSIYLKSNTGANYVVSQRIEDDRQQITVTKEWQRFTFSSSSLVNGTSGLWLRGGYGSDDYADLLVYGAQTENLSYATSYIPTNGASQTRAAETCSDAGTVSTFNSTEGTIYFEGSALANDGTFRILSLSNGTTSNEIKIQLSSVANTVGYGVVVGGIPQIDQFYTINNALSNNKFSAKYKANDFALWINGVEVLTDSSGITFPNGTLNTLNFNRGNGNNNFYSNTKDIRVYNEALTDAQLQTLTTL
jgi:hypothetical protein